MRAVYGEMQQKVPDLVPLLDPEQGPGMHATDSLDLVVAVAGRVRLVLERRDVHLRPGMRSYNMLPGMPGATRPEVPPAGGGC
jgi:hypothetical protein